MEERMELLNKIIGLCFEINEIGEKNTKLCGKPCLFFNFSGHTGSLDVDVHLMGWEADVGPDKQFTMYGFSSIDEYEYLINYLETLKGRL